MASWQLIFEIFAGIGAVGAISYCILFNGEEQPWNRVPADPVCDQVDEETEQDIA